MSAKYKIELDSNGDWFKVYNDRTPIDPSKIFSKYIQELGFLTPLLGAGTFAFFQKNTVTVMQIISDMPFDTSWTLLKADEDAVVLHPAFMTGMPGATIQPPFKFKPPSTMRLTLCMDPKVGAYLFAQDKRTGVLWHPILPNIYSNAEVCMGEASYPAWDPSLGLSVYIDRIYESWSSASWNSDLIEEAGPGLIQWLQFDESTHCNIIPDGDWTAYSSGKVGPGGSVNAAMAALHERLGDA